MEELEEKTFKQLFQNLLKAGIIRENFKGSITVHITDKQAQNYEIFQRRQLRKKM